MIDREMLVICGHEHWETRIARCGRSQVLNVHEAVVLLTSAVATRGICEAMGLAADSWADLE